MSDSNPTNRNWKLKKHSPKRIVEGDREYSYWDDIGFVPVSHTHADGKPYSSPRWVHDRAAELNLEHCE